MPRPTVNQAIAAPSTSRPVIPSRIFFDIPSPQNRRIAALDIPVFVTESRSFADVVQSIADVGALSGRHDAAHLLATKMRERKQRVEESVRGRHRPAVLVVLATTPLMAAGAGTFIDEMVTSAGGRNGTP